MNRIAAVARADQLVPPLRLGGLDELEQIGRVHTGNTVEIGLVALADGLHPPVATMLHQPPGDVRLERSLVSRTHPSITIPQNS